MAKIDDSVQKEWIKNLWMNYNKQGVENGKSVYESRSRVVRQLDGFTETREIRTCRVFGTFWRVGKSGREDMTSARSLFRTRRNGMCGGK